MTKKRKKTPSREKYEVKRPTFSFRIYEELKARIQEVKKVEGISNTNIVEAGVGLFEVKNRKEKEVRDQAYEEGYEEAKNLYMVTYPCEICGKMIEVMSTKQREAIRRYMLKYGWGHADCVATRY
jgi:hypothetical protein